METWQSSGNTGNTTGTNQEDRSVYDNGNTYHNNGSRSTFRSGSELTSDSEYADGPRCCDNHESNPDDTDVFLPATRPVTSEPSKIMAQKQRELPAGHRSWKRVADYVNNLPSIPEPGTFEAAKKERSTQAKRQRIWSEGHVKRKVFAEAGSQSFAEGMTSARKYTTSTSSNLSQLSSQWSQGSSQTWYDSTDDGDKTMHVLPPSPPPLPGRPSANDDDDDDEEPPPDDAAPQDTSAACPPAAADYRPTPSRVKQPAKPRSLLKEISGQDSSTFASQDETDSFPTKEGADSRNAAPPNPRRPRLLQRRMTNSDLIALASQHRQQQSVTQKRQNLYRMGSSNISDSSDTDISGQSLNSIDDLLIARHDPEELLLNLGFGGSAKEDFLDRIPSRFLQQPSQANGISLYSFLNQIDEVERGCGFSLLGGLRGLGSALRRSSTTSVSPPVGLMTAPSFAPCAETPDEDPNEPNIEGSHSDNHRDSLITLCNNSLPKSAVEVKGHKHDVDQVRNRNHDIGRCETEVQETVQRVSSAIDETSQGVEDIDDVPEPDPTALALPALLSPIVEERSVPHSPAVQNSRKFVFVDTSASKAGDHTGTSQLDDTSLQPSASNADDYVRTLPMGPSPVDHHARTNTPGDTSLNPSLVIGTSETEATVPVQEKSSIDPGVKTKGLPGRPRPVQLDIVSCGLTSGRTLENREDSFEFEELSSEEKLEDNSGAIQAAELDPNQQGNRSRSGSTQSDSSGFADEGIGSTELASPHRTKTAGNSAPITSDSKITQTSFDTEPIELFDPLEITQQKGSLAERIDALMTNHATPSLPSVTSLDDSPFDDDTSAKVVPSSNSKQRNCSYPRIIVKVKESGPKNPIEILTSLHQTSSELSHPSRNAPATSRKRPPRLMKMRSVDPECYGYKSHVSPTEDDNGMCNNATDKKDKLPQNISRDPGHECKDSGNNERKLECIVANSPESDRLNSSNNNSTDINVSLQDNSMDVCKFNDDIMNTNNECAIEESPAQRSIIQPETPHPKIIPSSANCDQTETLMSSTSHESECASFVADASQKDSIKSNKQTNGAPQRCKNPISIDQNHSREQIQRVDIEDAVQNASVKQSEENGVAAERSKSIHNEHESDCHTGEKQKDTVGNKSTLSDVRLVKVGPTWSSVMSDAETPNSSFQSVDTPFTAYRSSESEIVCQIMEDTHGNDAEDASLGCHGDSDNLKATANEEPIQPCMQTNESTSIQSTSVIEDKPSAVDSVSRVVTRDGSSGKSICNDQISTSQSSCIDGADSAHLCDATTQSVQFSGTVAADMHPSGSHNLQDTTGDHVTESHDDQHRSGDPIIISSSERKPVSDSIKDIPSDPKDRRLRVLNKQSCDALPRSGDSNARSGDTNHSSHAVREETIQPIVETDQLAVRESHDLSRSRSSTRIEEASEEEHMKAREDLKLLLSTEGEVSVLRRASPISTRSSDQQDAVEDLKLLQRALCRYHRDLDGLETMSSRLYQEVGFTMTKIERDDLISLSKVRHEIKDEVATLEESLMEQYQTVVTGSKNQREGEENLWSPGLTQVMCEMVRLLKEQESLRRVLDDLYLLDDPPSSPPDPQSDPPTPQSETSTLPPVPTHNERGSSRLSQTPDSDASRNGIDSSSKVKNDPMSEVIESLREVSNLTFPGVMSEEELMEELVKTQTDLASLRVKARRDVATAVREAKDLEIENLKSLVKQLQSSNASAQDTDAPFGH